MLLRLLTLSVVSIFLILGGRPAIAGAPVSDNFNSSTLNSSLWTFVNPVGDGSYSLNGSELQLSVPRGVNHDVWSTGDNGVRMMQPITNVNFQVIVKMDSPLMAGSQMEGVLVEQTATNFLRFDLRHDDVSPRLFAASISGSTGTFQVDFALPSARAPFWLKINRSGNTWTESYSTDGVSYTVGGTFSRSMTTTKIGVFAGNFGQPASSAPALLSSFDFFLNPAAGPDMTIKKTHAGSFMPGGSGTYTITATNSGTAATTAPVTVTDTAPSGLTVVSLSGTGWTCGLTPSPNCTRSDVLAGGSAYPPITLNVSVAANAPATVTNMATVAGGGETNTSNDTASDPTTIQYPQHPPVISAISATPTATSATIQWTTDETASSRVDYGTTTAYGQSASNSALVTGHSIVLNNLICTTSYQFKVTSVDQSGDTSSSNNQSFTTTACSSGGPVSDNFDALTLNTALWTFVNPAGDGVLSLNGSEVQITVPHGASHDLWTSGNRSARILQSIQNTDFQVEIRFNSMVMFSSQIEGIIVQQDLQNYIRFDTYHDGATPRLFCATFSNGSPTVQIDTPIVSSSQGPPLWMRVSRAGNSWTQSYSTDGTNYTTGAVFTHTLTVSSIGPFAGNAANSSGDTPAFSASIDYFFNAASPLANNDGPLPFDRFVVDPNPATTTLEKALGDIDGDGRLDAVIGYGNPPGSSGGAGVWWYQNPHSGNPKDKWNRYPILSSGQMYEDLTAFDVNGDGAVDVIASFDVSGEVYWFENPRGHGGNPATDVWVQHLIGSGTGENNMTLADIDGDGKMDLVTNGFIFFQNGPDSWTRIAYNRMSNGTATLDIGSGHGAINLIGMATFAPFPFVWLENPREHGGNARTETWTPHVIGPGYDSTGNAPASFATADLNGDGRMDLVTAFSEGTNPPQVIGALWWWEAPLDRRNGTWIKHVIDASFTSAHNIRVADIDGNGAIDIVTSEQEQAPERRVSVFYNDGAANFSQRILSNGSGHNLALGDLDGDGDIDILNAGHGFFGAPHPIEIYRNRRKP